MARLFSLWRWFGLNSLEVFKVRSRRRRKARTRRHSSGGLGLEFLHGREDSCERHGFILPRPAYQPALRASFRPVLERLEERITPVVINNGLATTTVGFFSANVQNAGVVSTAPGTYQGQSGTIFTNVNFIYQYKAFIHTPGYEGAMPTQLASTTIDSPVASTVPNSTSSAGHFTGSNSNRINWTVVSTLAPNSTELISTTTFTAATGTLGSLRFVNYLDEDVFSSGNDLLNPRNTPGTNAFVVGYFDGPQRVGFAQGGTQEAGTGLQNATYLGWAGGTYNGVENRILANTQTFSVAGVIGDSLVQSNDPDLGTIYGPADVGSAMAWDILATATTATITTRLVQFATDAGAPPPAPPAPTANAGPVAGPLGSFVQGFTTLLVGSTFSPLLVPTDSGGSRPAASIPVSQISVTLPFFPPPGGARVGGGNAPGSPVDIGATEGSEINGLVFRLTLDGDRPAQATVVLEAASGGQFVPIGTVTTDADGRFSFTALPAGRYRLRSAAPEAAGNLIIRVRPQLRGRSRSNQPPVVPDWLAAGLDPGTLAFGLDAGLCRSLTALTVAARPGEVAARPGEVAARPGEVAARPGEAIDEFFQSGADDRCDARMAVALMLAGGAFVLPHPSPPGRGAGVREPSAARCR